MFVAACGGGGGGGSDVAADGTVPPGVTAQQTPTKMEAARFLGQATFGPSESEIDRLAGMSYGAWIDDQFSKPQTLHRLYINQAAADLASVGQTISRTNFWDSWWQQALSGEDQLRQRAAFALSQILVVSFADATLANQPRGVASYYDMLAEHAFGNYRDLLENVARHPMMGIYLSHMRNLKEDPATGRVPDLNFAREITQLFAVGENKLNLDGTVVMGANGRPEVAYTGADLMGLAQVFTGWSWYAGPELSDRTAARYNGQNPNLERDWRPMQAYNEYTANTSFHSVSEKKFWATTIPAQTKADTEGDFKIAIDTVFNHPNVAPFVSKQLIQRLVTSNPSPAYVRRVATVFNDNGNGVRGDMKSVWKAILLDSEARTAGTSATYGKVREPVIRLANMLRAFDAKSTSNRFTGIGDTDNPATRLGQTPMFAPTVFNFFRPGYVPTSKAITDAGLVVPELQITHDISVAGYMNYIRTWTTLDANRDIKHSYAKEIELADKPVELVDRMNLLLFNGTMPETLKTQIVTAVSSRVLPVPTYTTTATTGGTLTKIADEGGAFTVTGTGTVRYGSGMSFVERSVTGAGTCGVAFFGSDPIVGTMKSCFLFTPTSAAGGASAPTATQVPTNATGINNAKLDRVYLAVFMSMASPDYLVQK
ncbi:MAG TPA: DUF1800 domain-containing protein [Caldimonas sp.]|nr:DUF1800 domain-containing protein [Caldimonas sp.]HEX2542472.1 DUF1800 domain-containing protein [Caldimonas sp.]